MSDREEAEARVVEWKDDPQVNDLGESAQRWGLYRWQTETGATTNFHVWRPGYEGGGVMLCGLWIPGHDEGRAIDTMLTRNALVPDNVVLPGERMLPPRLGVKYGPGEFPRGIIPVCRTCRYLSRAKPLAVWTAEMDAERAAAQQRQLDSYRLIVEGAMVDTPMTLDHLNVVWGGGS